MARSRNTAPRPGICFLLPSLRPGGTELHVAALAGFLARLGFPTTVACLVDGGPLADTIEGAGARVEPLGLRGIFDAAGPVRLLRLFRETRPAVVHSYLFGMDLVGVLPARVSRVPRVLVTRRETASWMRARHRVVRNAANALADKVICCCDALARLAVTEEGVDPSSIVVIRNGVDTGRFRPDPGQGRAVRRELGIPASAVVAGTVASFGSEKGHDVLLRAARDAASRMPDLRFVWVGDGPLRSSLEAAVEAAGLSDRILFTGFRPDVWRLMHSFDIVVCSSSREGLPNVVLESMASGKAVLTTAVGGVPEVLRHDETGCIVRPGDAEALAREIARLCGSVRLREVLGANARTYALAALGLEQSHARYVDLYTSLFA